MTITSTEHRMWPVEKAFSLGSRGNAFNCNKARDTEIMGMFGNRNGQSFVYATWQFSSAFKDSVLFQCFRLEQIETRRDTAEGFCQLGSFFQSFFRGEVSFDLIHSRFIRAFEGSPARRLRFEIKMRQRDLEVCFCVGAAIKAYLLWPWFASFDVRLFVARRSWFFLRARSSFANSSFSFCVLFGGVCSFAAGSSILPPAPDSHVHVAYCVLPRASEFAITRTAFKLGAFCVVAHRPF